MQVLSQNYQQFSFPNGLVKAHYYKRVPVDFQDKLLRGAFDEEDRKGLESPTLYSAQLPEILDWLHGFAKPQIFEEKADTTPLLLCNEMLSFNKVVFHYEGHPLSAQLIKRFVNLFGPAIKESGATIISPSFIPKSKMKEEQELIQLVNKATAETSFIKFNFNRVGDFWSYAVKQDATLLVIGKNYQADLAKILFHFYKERRKDKKLSFYLAS